MHPGTFPAGVDLTFGKSGEQAVVQAVHLPADWSKAQCKSFLRERGFLAASIRLEPRSINEHDCWSCGKTYGWNLHCKRCLARPKAIDPSIPKLPFAITKADEELQIAFGWFYVVERADGTKTVDHSREISDLSTVEKAGYGYVLDSRKGGVMHQRADGEIIQIGRLAEFCVMTPEKKALWGVTGSAHSLHTGIWGGIRIDHAETWANTKAGIYPDFSVGIWTQVKELN